MKLFGPAHSYRTLGELELAISDMVLPAHKVIFVLMLVIIGAGKIVRVSVAVRVPHVFEELTV